MTNIMYEIWRPKSQLFICLFVCKDVLDLESALTIIQLSHFTRSENGFHSTGDGDYTSIACLRFYDYIDDFDHLGEAFCLNVLGVFC